MIAITYIGHATALIEIDGVSFLTDPNFSSRILCIKRLGAMNYDPAGLPELSAVLISHAHFDHLDISSFKYIKGTVPVFAPVGIGKFISKFIRNPVIELNQWASHKLQNGAEVHAVSALHMGFRWNPLLQRECNSYVISNGSAKVYFAGDTGYGSHFKEIGRMYSANGPIEVALLPIGGYAPAWLMQRYHMNPGEAVQAFLDLGAKNMVPIHYGTFRLSNEGPTRPLEWLSRLKIEQGLEDKIHILQSGEKFSSQS